jgi:hypothetical protein
VSEVLGGSLPMTELVVEFMIVEKNERAAVTRIGELARVAPSGDMVLFLRHKGGKERGLYRLVNSAGLWATAPWNTAASAVPQALPSGPRAIPPLNDEAFASAEYTLGDVQRKAKAGRAAAR